MRIQVTNAKVLFLDCPRWALLEIDKQLSYPVKGAWFSGAYRSGRWDGCVHMVKVVRGQGYCVPIGLLPDFLQIVRNLEVKHTIENARAPRKGHKLSGVHWRSERSPRDYQLSAVHNVLEGKPGAPDLGILKMPIRSGKTLTAALLIRAARLRTLFVVPSTLLLNQTLEVFRSCFTNVKLGVIGDGIYDAGDITVATFQSLVAGLKRKLKTVEYVLSETDLLIVDECHHLEAEQWRAPLLRCEAYMRVGLSATAYIHHRRVTERSAIWLKALCGPVVYDVSMKYLIRKGWLVPTTVELHAIDTPQIEGTWGTELYDQLITHNTRRNAQIVRSALDAKARGQRVLVDIGRVQHGRVLLAYLQKAGLAVALMTGHTDKTIREETIRALKAQELDVIVSTLLGEGVDIPELEVVINAEGGASRKATIQRLRNMTPAEGKEGALIVDFVDLTNPYLTRHSEKRLKAYKKEDCFRITVPDATKRATS